MRLPPGEIHVWRARCSATSDPSLLAAYRELMSAEEAARCRRYRLEQDRHRHLLARVLVRTALSGYGGRPPGDWQFALGAQDKPELLDPPLPLRFNISHSGDFVVCAFGLVHDLGIDVESMERSSDVLAIARHYFSGAERAALERVPAAQQRDRFFDFWTLKEAYMKARGEGISLGLGNFSFSLPPGGGIAIDFAPALVDDPAHWHFGLYDPAPGYRMALAWRPGTGAEAPRVRQFDAVPLRQITAVEAAGER